MSEAASPNRGSRVAAARHERESAARTEKLAHLREQVAAGTLVIREMSDAERARWGSQHAASEASATAAERARRARAMENRRRREARLES